MIQKQKQPMNGLNIEVSNLINTVLGPISKEALGKTLSHEHLKWEYIDSWKMYFNHQYNEKETTKAFVQLEPVLNELKQKGIDTIVEASPPRGGQNLKLMQRLSQATGIHLIPNTGMAFKRHVYTIHKDFDLKALAKKWINDYHDGLDKINGVLIQPAQIKLLLGDAGEAPLDDIDQKILSAAIIASQETQLPIHCHLLQATSAQKVINLLIDENFDFSKFLWAHACREGNLKVMEEVYSKGGWLGFDQIRAGNHDYTIELIKEAISRGFKDRLLLSMDYDFCEEVENNRQENLTSFFAFYSQAIAQGINAKDLKEILTINPAEFLDH